MRTSTRWFRTSKSKYSRPALPGIPLTNPHLDVMRSGTQFGPLASQAPPSVSELGRMSQDRLANTQMREDHPVLDTIMQSLGGAPAPDPMILPGTTSALPRILS